jgi:alpha-N-arabinofuranosidase
MFIRTPKEKWYSLTSRKGFLEINLRPETVSGTGNPSFIARRQQHSYCSVSTALEFSAGSENEKAGLAAYQMEEYFYFFCKSKIGNEDVVQLYKSNKNKEANNMELITQKEIEGGIKSGKVFLKIEVKGKEFSFYYAVSKDKWILLQDKVDASFLSPRNVYGFVGTVFGMYATSLGVPSNNKAGFDWLEYSGKDQLTK